MQLQWLSSPLHRLLDPVDSVSPRYLQSYALPEDACLPTYDVRHRQESPTGAINWRKREPVHSFSDVARSFRCQVHRATVLSSIIVIIPRLRHRHSTFLRSASPQLVSCVHRNLSNRPSPSVELGKVTASFLSCLYSYPTCGLCQPPHTRTRTSTP